MTAISPLEFVNKKGLFGDHHKKKESNLIQIMEFKNLNIIKIFQYKKSNISLDNIKIDNLEMPTENSKVMSNKFTRILCIGPKTWLIVSNKNITEDIKSDIPYTPKDKFIKMTEENPSLKILQQKLGLDPDY